MSGTGSSSGKTIKRRKVRWVMGDQTKGLCVSVPETKRQARGSTIRKTK